MLFFFFSSRRRHTRFSRDWSSDVCSSDLIDAFKVVSEGVNRLRSSERAFVVITHYQRLLNYIMPDVVHVLSRGRIARTGGKELALELEAKGYAQYQEEAV